MKNSTRHAEVSNSRKVLELLRRFECRNVTFIEPDQSWPVVWERARDCFVWDADGKRYLDLTAAFGVAATGHANPRVVRAGQRQMRRLLHAMGDVHPHALKAELARELSRITFERWSGLESRLQPAKRNDVLGTAGGISTVNRLKPGLQTKATQRSGKTIFCNSGFEAVEAALKTSALATRKAGVIAFSGGYHGLGYGALNVTHRDHFHAPFQSQLKQFGHFVQFPCAVADAKSLKQTASEIRQLCASNAIGTVLVEPVQGRAGIRVPPLEFLPLLRSLCDELRLVLICDEVFTGFGRTGRWFACEHSNVIPDIICLGKALAGGFPISACVGESELMDRAWPAATGEALHTSTFLGHPVGCAMALAQIREIERLNLPKRSATVGERFLKLLLTTDWPAGFQYEIRGPGLMIGMEIRLANGQPATEAVLMATKRMLREGFILLPEGEQANVISFTPPLTVTERQLENCAEALRQVLKAAGDPSSTRTRTRTRTKQRT